MNFKSKIESRYIIRADYKKYLGKLWVHYTTHEELKFNYKPFHTDPIGVYFFPESFRTGGSWHVKPYKFTARVKPEAHVLDVSKIKNPEDVKEALNKLKVEYTSDGSLEKTNIPGRWFWQYLRDKFISRQGAFTKLFLNAGYDAVFDDSDSIFLGEDQLIVFNPKVLKDVKRIDQGATGYKEVAKAREVILDILKGYDGKVIEAKKPKKKRGFASDPDFIESKIFFKKEEDGREAVFTIQTATSSMGGSKRRPATKIDLSVKGSSPAFKEHLGSYYNSWSQRPNGLEWRLEEFDPTQIKPWLEKSIHILWNDEEVLKEKKRRDDFKKKLELQRERYDELEAWSKENLSLPQQKSTPHSYKSTLEKILTNMARVESEDDMKKTSVLIDGLQKFIDSAKNENLKQKIASEKSKLHQKLQETGVRN